MIRVAMRIVKGAQLYATPHSLSDRRINDVVVGDVIATVVSCLEGTDVMIRNRLIKDFISLSARKKAHEVACPPYLLTVPIGVTVTVPTQDVHCDDAHLQCSSVFNALAPFSH